ncbi:hypothetical protein QVD17_30626 [Tagetes erecta]|uniref:3-hydroxyisobutyryl-CoA hydrolase n=1 Tax=Tagetes erecta TaxID=13708 RepID=A0AAD8K898_TARER|nr:hypothetical protein QVD17_30626 [Tagetes erecta]
MSLSYTIMGDLVAVAQARVARDVDEEAILKEAKKYVGECMVAILDGITMGGGAAISIPGTFRITTDKTVYATPETLIGLHPDVGASFHLSHLPGEYLGLTGDRLNGLEMIACGLATHSIHTVRLNVQEIEECLKNLVTDDPSVIKTSLEKYSDFDYPDNNSGLKSLTSKMLQKNESVHAQMVGTY